MTPLVLYSTLGCHLCETAQGVIYGVLGRTVAEVDVAEDDALLARYGERIPVLHRTDTGAELGWPFDAGAVRALVEAG